MLTKNPPLFFQSSSQKSLNIQNMSVDECELFLVFMFPLPTPRFTSPLTTYFLSPLSLHLYLSEWHSYSHISESGLIHYIIDKLERSTTGFIAASQLCADIRENASRDAAIDDAGRFKYFCLDHDDKIKWDPAGSGRVGLVKMGSIPVGAKVSIKTAQPSRGWGLTHAWSVGIVRSFSGSTYVVDFLEVEKRVGEEEDLAMVSGGDRSAQDFGTKDPAFDQFGFARNKDGGQFEFTGDGKQENRGRHLWEFGFLHGAQKLTPSRSYFEVKIIINRADGIGIGLAGSSFHAGSMVG